MLWEKRKKLKIIPFNMFLLPMILLSRKRILYHTYLEKKIKLIKILYIKSFIILTNTKTELEIFENQNDTFNLSSINI